ncbi:MAG: hypothetical protein A2474_03800 [Elusimicrobia bacterium RIFOXYC2_FULL_34_12]|nr:MAG: hypothetical protein A2474_03800 [Elusimicrobia bacterium RIFOXYC2_FULL_34_12]
MIKTMNLMNKIIFAIVVILLLVSIKLTATTSKPIYDELLLTSQKSVFPDYDIIKNLDEFIILNHTVQKGENINKIAKKYGIDVATIRGINNLETAYVGPNKNIWVVNKKGHIYTVKKGDNFEVISKKYGINMDTILIANDFDEDEELSAGDKVFIPGIKIHFADFLQPVLNYRITSRFGLRRHPIFKYNRFHEGVDFGRCNRAPVRASSSGRVVFAGTKFGYGKVVTILHKNGFSTRYAHLRLCTVKNNQYVKAGSIIGRVGSTGFSTGPHLHFEVRKYGRAVDPLKYIGKQIF